MKFKKYRNKSNIVQSFITQVTTSIDTYATSDRINNNISNNLFLLYVKMLYRFKANDINTIGINNITVTNKPIDMYARSLVLEEDSNAPEIDTHVNIMINAILNSMPKNDAIFFIQIPLYNYLRK